MIAANSAGRVIRAFATAWDTESPATSATSKTAVTHPPNTPLPSVADQSVTQPEMEHTMKPLRPLAAATFILGPVIYLAAEAIAAAAWKSPTYSYADNWISDLGSATAGVFQGRELNSPLHVVMNTGFIVQGLLFGIATLLLSRTISGRSVPSPP